MPDVHGDALLTGHDLTSAGINKSQQTVYGHYLALDINSLSSDKHSVQSCTLSSTTATVLLQNVV